MDRPVGSIAVEGDAIGEDVNVAVGSAFISVGTGVNVGTGVDIGVGVFVGATYTLTGTGVEVG